MYPSEAESLRERLRIVMHQDPQSIHWYAKKIGISHTTLRSFMYPTDKSYAEITERKIRIYLEGKEHSENESTG